MQYRIFKKCTIRENILQLRLRSVIINEYICLIVSLDILTFIFPAVRLLPSWWYKRGWNWLWQYDLHLGAFRLDCGWPCSNHRKTCERDEADRASWIVAAGEEVSRGRVIDFRPARCSSSSFFSSIAAVTECLPRLWRVCREGMHFLMFWSSLLRMRVHVYTELSLRRAPSLYSPLGEAFIPFSRSEVSSCFIDATAKLSRYSNFGSPSVRQLLIRNWKSKMCYCTSSFLAICDSDTLSLC